LSLSSSLAYAIDSPFNIGKVRVWCQAHTGALGQNNRNKGGVDRVSHDWLTMKADVEATAIKPLELNVSQRAVKRIRADSGRKLIKVRSATHSITRKDNKMNIFVLNNKAFERQHREIYPLDNKLEGFAIYDYDARQVGRNPDLNMIRPGDLALVFGKDRTVKDIYRVTGIRARYAPDVNKDVFVIYGERFASLDERMIYSQFITANKLSCSRVDHNNNFTIGMLTTLCMPCENQSLTISSSSDLVSHSANLGELVMTNNVNQEASTIPIDDRVIAICINEQYRHCKNAAELYTCTRGLWRLRKERANNAKYALATYHGVVNEVYEIDDWLPATKAFSDFWVEKLRSQGRVISPKEHVGRYEFTGKVASERMRKKYIGRVIPTRHRGNPVLYFNC
jgi:hypothetical protein